MLRAAPPNRTLTLRGVRRIDGRVAGLLTHAKQHLKMRTVLSTHPALYSCAGWVDRYGHLLDAVEGLPADGVARVRDACEEAGVCFRLRTAMCRDTDYGPLLQALAPDVWVIEADAAADAVPFLNRHADALRHVRHVEVMYDEVAPARRGGYDWLD